MKRSIVVFSLMAMSGLAFADGFSYTYAQATYGKVDIDDPAFTEDGDGLGVNGSFGITDNLNIVASFQTADFDTLGDLDELTAGLGVHTTLLGVAGPICRYRTRRRFFQAGRRS